MRYCLSAPFSVSNNVSLNRLSTMSMESYIEVDYAIENGKNQDRFLDEKLGAHKPAVLVVLRGILGMSKIQLRRNIYWISPILSNIIVVNDREVRQCARAVFEQHVNTWLNEA